MLKGKASNLIEIRGKANPFLDASSVLKFVALAYVGLNRSRVEKLVRSQVFLINSWTCLIWLRTEPSSPTLAFWGRGSCSEKTAFCAEDGSHAHQNSSPNLRGANHSKTLFRCSVNMCSGEKWHSHIFQRTKISRDGKSLS